MSSRDMSLVRNTSSACGSPSNDNERIGDSGRRDDAEDRHDAALCLDVRRFVGRFGRWTR